MKLTRIINNFYPHFLPLSAFTIYPSISWYNATIPVSQLLNSNIPTPKFLFLSKMLIYQQICPLIPPLFSILFITLINSLGCVQYSLQNTCMIVYCNVLFQTPSSSKTRAARSKIICKRFSSEQISQNSASQFQNTRSSIVNDDGSHSQLNDCLLPSLRITFRSILIYFHLFSFQFINSSLLFFKVSKNM
ncbi:Hypothetical_protein [Hexamita inflata]|uniref:Hypothetical_protein n=1 Tax=Hexamita inflata TaxID=28002 RepID=A0AA86NSJ8_9EUKA|nr:Hypothetical protein HINF_LOCUS12321 [Hexamita inflata]